MNWRWGVCLGVECHSTINLSVGNVYMPRTAAGRADLQPWQLRKKREMEI